MHRPYIKRHLTLKELHFRSRPEYISCKVIATPSKYNPYNAAMAFQKNSMYLALFNYYLRDMKEKGTFYKIANKYEPPPQICPDAGGLPLGFNSCFTAFLPFLCAITISLTILVIENYVRRRMNRHQYNKECSPPTNFLDDILKSLKINNMKIA